MVLPFLLARIEKGHCLLRDRIVSINLVVLVVVTSLTGERKILRSGLAATTPRNNMLYRECIDRIAHGASTILAIPSGALYNLLSQSSRNKLHSTGGGLMPSASIKSGNVVLRKRASSTRASIRSACFRSASSLRAS